MNPKEFGWDESQQVTVTNPTGKDYRFKVHNKDYEVKAGQTVKMPGFIAWVYVYGLSTQIAQDENKFSHWNEEGFRQQYYTRLTQDVDNVIQVVETEPETFEEDGEEMADDEASEETAEPEKVVRRRRRRVAKTA
jgi:hypothetical protein